MPAIKITLVSLIIFNLTMPGFTLAQTQLLEQPQNMDEAKELVEESAKVAQKEIPGVIERVWKEEVLPVWQKMFNWAKVHIWENQLDSRLKNIWSTTLRILKGEVEERKPTVKEEFQKEKEELKQEAPQVGQSLWEKFKELIK